MMPRYFWVQTAPPREGYAGAIVEGHYVIEDGTVSHADARDKVARAARNAVREVEILHEREAYAARTNNGGTIADLRAPAASGYKAGAILVDVPSKFEVYSGKGKQRAADRYYDTMTLDELKAMAPLVQALAAKDCALFYWTTGPQMKHALDIVAEWGFAFKTLGFVWVKTQSVERNAGTRRP